MERGGLRAALLVIAGFLLAGRLLPWGVLGLALELAAVVLAWRTLRRARASGGRAPGALAALIAGSVGTVVLLVLLGFVAFFHEEYREYERCFGRAITESAKAQCRSTFEDQLRDQLGLRR